MYMASFEVFLNLLNHFNIKYIQFNYCMIVIFLVDDNSKTTE